MVIVPYNRLEFGAKLFEINIPKMADFSEFTNMYSLSKTLRFELKPIGNTQAMLEENQVLQKDEHRQLAYKAIKPYFDQLHREFVQESLAEAVINGIGDYSEVLSSYKKDRTSKTIQKDIDAQKKLLREQVVSHFDAIGKKWAAEDYSHLRLKNKDISILFEEQVFAILKDRYGHEKKTELIDESTGEIKSIFDNWKGFTGYFTKFFETRKNLYKSDGTATAIATRIVDENLVRFIENINTFNTVKDRLNISEVEEFFGLDAATVFATGYYNSCLLQSGIDKYNDFLGGKTLASGEKKKGINELINQYRQTNKGEKLPFLKKLNKQILSEKESDFFVLENEDDARAILKTFQINAAHKLGLLQKLLNKFFAEQDSFSLDNIYISKEALNTISYKWTRDTAFIQDSLYHTLKELKLVKTRGKDDEEYSFPEFIALAHIREALESVRPEDKIWKDSYYRDTNDDGTLNRTESTWNGFMLILKHEFANNFKSFERSNSLIKNALQAENVDLQSIKAQIKDFADSALWTYQLGKYFAVEKKRKWDETYILDDFYTDPTLGYSEQYYPDAYEQIVRPYNDIRNFLTKKPHSEDKWKLNFEKGNLLGGWPDSPEGNTQYGGFIFRRDGKYYLGVTDYPRIFDDRKYPLTHDTAATSTYEKMIYKQVDAKTLYGSTYKGLFGTKYSDDQRLLSDAELLGRMKLILEAKAGNFLELTGILSDLNAGKFEDAKSLARAISDGSFYNINFMSVPSAYVERGRYELGHDKKGKPIIKHLYLFQIYNRDFAKGKTGKKNLHTIYFEELFSKENIEKNFILKLNGQAEIFYRPKTDAGKLGYKKDKRGKEVINSKRYSESKIFFHVPITLNRVSKNVSRFNLEVNNFLANNPEINIIGVDRGEKHLAYYSVINQRGKLLQSGSLNTVNRIDYADKLEAKAHGREQARKDWQQVEAIKDLKKGYISQVIRKLADLAIEHNAIIVLEDLNMRFKQIRGGIEKSIYQQLEKALIEKLSFMVNKGEVDANKAGHLLKAYQLATPVDSFKDMGKQTGIIFYTQAAYTSRIDPLTGWRPNLYLKYTNAEKARSEISKFKWIEYDAQKGRFEFAYDLRDFVVSKEYPLKTEWVLCSGVERFRWDRKLNSNRGGYTHYKSLTPFFKQLLEEFGIDYQKDIVTQIVRLSPSGNEKFFRDFIYFFNLVCQIRNTQQSKSVDENDFILSPVEPFFDSRIADAFGEGLPRNGDENGAYNIARKGLVILEKISNFQRENSNTEKLGWRDLYISHADWDNFATRSDKA